MSENKSVLPSKDAEEGSAFRPKFDVSGLLTAVAIDQNTRDVLMVAHMNAESLAKTLETGEAWYWSRSRGELWRKGDTSGQVQTIAEIRVDCDQDCLLLFVTVGGDGNSCHTGRASCFYRRVDTAGQGTSPQLSFIRNGAHDHD